MHAVQLYVLAIASGDEICGRLGNIIYTRFVLPKKE